MLTYPILLVLKLWILGGLMIGLHRISVRYGLGPLLICVGGIAVLLPLSTAQDAELTLLPAFTELQSTNVYFPLIVLGIFLLYAFEATDIARLSILGNLAMVVLAFVNLPDSINGVTLPPSAFASLSIALAIAQIEVALLYQTLINRLRARPWLSAGIALWVSLLSGAFVFQILYRSTTLTPTTLQNDIVSATISTFAFWPLITFYMIRIAPRMMLGQTNRPRRILALMSGRFNHTEIPTTRSQARLRQRTHDLAALYDATRVFLSYMSVHHIVENVCRQAVQGFELNVARLDLIGSNGDEIQTTFVYPMLEDRTQDTPRADCEPIAQVLHTGRDVVLNHIDPQSINELCPPHSAQHPARALAAIPLQHGKRILGVLTLFSAEPGHFTQPRMEILKSYAQVTAIALINARLFEAEQHQLQELIILHAVATAGAEATVEQHLIERVTQVVGAILYPDNFSVLLIDPMRNVLHLNASYQVNEKNKTLEIALGQGVAGQVAADGCTQMVHDPTDNIDLGISPGTRSQLCVPLKIDSRIIGVINAASTRSAAFDRDDERLLTTVASQLATAIEKVRLFEAERQRRHEAETLYEATSALTSALERRQVLEAILVSLKHMMPYDNASITLLEKDQLHIVANSSAPDLAGRVGRKFPADTLPFRELQLTRQPLCFDDVTLEPRRQEWVGAIDNIRSWMGIPLIASDQVIGMLTISSRQPGNYGPHEVEWARAFANHAVIGIVNAQLFSAVSEALTREQRLNEVARIISSAPDLPNTYQAVVRLASELVGAEAGAISLLSNDGTLATHRYLFNLPEELNWHTLRGTGLVWQVIESGRPLLVPDYAQHSAAVPKWVAAGIRGAIVCPLLVGETRIGALGLFSLSQIDAFTERDLALAESIGAQAAIAIQNARLFEAERQHRTLAEALRDTAATLNTTLNFEEVLDRILTNVSAVVEHDAAAIAMVEEGIAYATRSAGRDAHDEGAPLSSAVWKVSETPTLRNMEETGKPIAVPDTHDSAAWIPRTDWIRSYAGAPIRIKQQVVGFLNLYSATPRFYDQTNVEHLQVFADQAAIAISNARLYAEAQRRLKEQTALRIAGAVMSSTLNLETVLNHIAEQMGRAISASSAYLCAYDQEAKTSTVMAEYISVDACEQEQQSDLNQIYRMDEFPDTIKHLRANQIAVMHVDEPHLSVPERKHMLKYGARSRLTIPLQVGGQVVAYADLWESRWKRTFSSDEIALCQGIAQQAAIAIDNARLYEAEREQRAIAVALRDTAAALNSTLHFDEVLDYILATVGQVVPHDSANIMLVQEGTARMARHRGYIESGFDASSIFTREFVIVETPSLNYMASTGLPLAVPFTKNNSYWLDSPFTRWVQSYAGAPIRMKGKMLGFLSLNSATPGFFTPTQAERLQVFANHAALSVENARLYDAVRLHADDLEYRVAERTAELAEANEQLKELDHLKDVFVSNVSHELRTPLANVKLYLGLLERGRPEKREHYMMTLNRESGRLENLIEDLLQLSRLDLGSIQPVLAPVDFNQLAADFVTDRTELASEKGLHLSFHPDIDLPAALIDQVMTTSTMSNMLTNAIRYNPPGGHITLSTAVQHYDEQDWITFTLADDGPGISEEEQTQLFDRFFRGEAGLESGTHGAGLGLAICKEMIAKMGGRITLDSRLGEGAAFTVWLRPANQTQSIALTNNTTNGKLST